MENTVDNIAVSVVIPVYNALKYIKDCIESVSNQTGLSFEIIMIDDGSKDGSSEICDSLAEGKENVYVYHIENSGVTYARKLGVEKSRGEYICFVDADDQLPENALSIMYQRVVNENIDILVTAKSRLSAKKNIFLKNKKVGFVNKEQYAVYTLDGSCFYGIGGRLTKRQLFISTKALDIPRDIENNEDLLMNLRLGMATDRILITNDINSYMYYDREGSASKNPKRLQLKFWKRLFVLTQEILSCGYSLDKCEEIKRAFLLMKLQRLSTLKWGENELNERDRFVNEFDKMKGLNKDQLRSLCILKYPFFNFPIKCVFKLLKLI